MARSIVRRLPRAPVRVTPGQGALPLVKDPIVQRLFRNLQDRISGQDEQLQDLKTYALKAGSPVDAYGQRLKNVGQPIARDDAVPLWYLRKFVSEQALVAEHRAGGDGDGEDGNGTTGAGSKPPTVPLADLLDEVRAYAAAHPTELANSCQDAGGTWDYMDGLVAYLQGIDERVGFNGKRGNVDDPSQDAIAYYHGILPPTSGSNDVYVVDVIGCHCPDGVRCTEAGPAWANVTTPRAAGAWLPTR